MAENLQVNAVNTDSQCSESKASNGVKSAVEALLFASEKPLTVDQLRKALDNLDAGQVRLSLEELKLEYEQAKRGMRLAEIAGGYLMVTAVEFAPFLKKLFKDRSSDRLSKPGLETLAIIAYKQPLTRFQIETLRNVNVDGVMRSLVEKGMIRICGRKKIPGRPFVYGTTKLFLEHFGLKSLNDLPKMEEFQVMAESKEASQDIELIPESDTPQEAEENNTNEQKIAEANNESKEPAA